MKVLNVMQNLNLLAKGVAPRLIGALSYNELSVHAKINYKSLYSGDKLDKSIFSFVQTSHIYNVNLIA